jgi:myo-inositol-1(or 4)-monophosphatase
MLGVAEEIARDAGRLLLERVGRPLEVRKKGEADLVTEADRASEALILRRLRDAFPSHAILSEEAGGAARSTGATPLWVVDPLDGTTNYAHGLPIWSVSIACLIRGQPVVGVVFDPSRAECFSAMRGGGAHLAGRPIRVSSEGTLSEAFLVTGFPYDVRTDSVDNLDHFARFIKASRAVRRLGSAAIDLAYVACGRFDGFWEMKIEVWDMAAGSLIVEEAGGVVRDFAGGPFAPFGREIVAANEALAREMVQILRRGSRPPPFAGGAP